MPAVFLRRAFFVLLRGKERHGREIDVMRAGGRGCVTARKDTCRARCGTPPSSLTRCHLPLQGRLLGGRRLIKPPLQGAAESSAACGGYSETEQVQRSQSTSVLQRAPCDAGTANRTVDAPQGADGGVHCRLVLQVSFKTRQALAPHP